MAQTPQLADVSRHIGTASFGWTLKDNKTIWVGIVVGSPAEGKASDRGIFLPPRHTLRGLK